MTTYLDTEGEPVIVNQTKSGVALIHADPGYLAIATPDDFIVYFENPQKGLPRVVTNINGFMEI
jgi:hypothetical protein